LLIVRRAVSSAGSSLRSAALLDGMGRLKAVFAATDERLSATGVLGRGDHRRSDVHRRAAVSDEWSEGTRSRDATAEEVPAVATRDAGAAATSAAAAAVDPRQFGQPPGVPVLHLLPAEAPLPGVFALARFIHAVCRVEAEDVLHRDDAERRHRSAGEADQLPVHLAVGVLIDP